MLKENELNKAYIRILDSSVPGKHPKMVDLWDLKYGKTLGESMTQWGLLFRRASPELKMIPEILNIVRDIYQEPSLLPEHGEEIGRRIPLSQVIEKLQNQNKELSKKVSLKDAQIRKLKQILREAYKPTILKKISIHGSILFSASLLISFVYGFNLIHPILASPMLLVSIVFLIISRGLKKSEKALA